MPELIKIWNRAPKTILAGDFNATPDPPETQALSKAGLIDVGGEIGPAPGYTFYSADPFKQIDYIWISPDLVTINFEIPPTTASDHLALL